MSHNQQKKIAVFNDYTGFGKCSLTVELPIISYLGIQCCPVPTAILSNHTGYDEYYFEDYTNHIGQYLDMWKKLDLRFEGICSGFLGSEHQIEIVRDFIKDYLKKDGIVVVDPIMADDGVAYETYTQDMCKRMKELVSCADIVTPNITEACILADTEYKKKWTLKELGILVRKIHDMGPDKIVITGIETERMLTNYIFINGEKDRIVRTKKIGCKRCGTGDVFSSIIAADAINGVDFYSSVKKATHFVGECLKETIKMDMDPNDGVVFENILRKL